MSERELAAALKARADWLDLPRDVEAPRPYITREQFRAAATKLCEHASLVAEVERLREARDGRQKVVADWCAASFGVGAASSLPQRAVRLLEEVIEAFQAAGGDPAMAHKLIDFVFARPVGDLNKEIGAVGLVLLSLANAAGVSADAEEASEVGRVLAKPNSHWAARNANKNAAGFDTSPSSLQPPKEGPG